MNLTELPEEFIFQKAIHSGRHTRVIQAIRKTDSRKMILKFPADMHAGIFEKARINHEYETLKTLSCKGVAKITDRVMHRQTPYLVFENFDGISLGDFIRKNKLSLDQFFEIAIQLSAALAEIHGKNIMHKDINPNNIVIDPVTLEIRIVDFGISATISRERSTVVNPNILEGTLAYISPEQTGRMNRSTDYRTDLYSLGITFYEMLAGAPPYSSTDSMELVHCHIARKLPDLREKRRDIPDVLWGIIQKLTSKIADERYQSAPGLREDLEKCRQSHLLGLVPDFSPGLSDTHSRFHIPEKLYGRENEIQQILSAFRQAAEGGTPLVLITGFSGIGKTALIHELHKPSVEKQGYFVSGKYNPFSRNQPFSGLAQALSELIRQVLSEMPEKVEAFKSALIEKLGPNLNLIAELVPELEVLTGPIPEVQKLNPTEAQNRLFFTFRNFISLFADARHPLALFLDDLQWADESTLGLIRELGTKGIPYFLLTGSYRNNEVTEGHPLSLLLEDLKQTQVALTEINLHSLEEKQVRQMVQDTLGVSESRASSLAMLLSRKTGGSPFFLNELLRKLYEDKLIYYSHTTDSWDWDEEKIQAHHISGDVAVFMAGRIGELPDSCRKWLQTAACIGNQFSLKLLAALENSDAGTVMRELMPALQAELILPLGDGYRFVSGNEDFNVSFRFQHDRIQQAAYILMGAEQRTQFHLRIGRMLQKQFTAEEQSERIIEIVRHLNEAQARITDEEKRFQLCEMNLYAGQRSMESAAYRAAFEYFKTGIDLLPARYWDTQYRLAFNLHAGFAQAAYLSSHEDLAESVAGDLIQRATTILDQVEILSVRLRQYTTTGKNHEAIETGLKGLKLLGIRISANPGPVAVLSEVLAAKWNLGRRKPAELLDAPVMKDAGKIAAARLLTEIAPAAYVLGNDNLYGLLTLKVVNLSLKYGNCREAPYAYIAFGMVLKEAFGDLTAAEEFGKMALLLNARMNDLEYRCRVYAAYGVLTFHFNHHWKDMADWTQKAVESGFLSGDLFYLVHSAGNSLVWNPTLTLSYLIREYPRYLKIVEETGYLDAFKSNQLSLQLRKNFAGQTTGRFSLDDAQFKEEEAVQVMKDRNYLSGLGIYRIHKTELYCFYEEFDKAFLEITEARRYEKSLVSLQVLTRLSFLSCITALQLARKGKKIPASQWKSELKKMKKWSDYNPVVFRHMFQLMQAEYLFYSGKLSDAAQAYELAIQLAREGQWIQNALMANLCAGAFYQQTRLQNPAGYYQEAFRLADQWEAGGMKDYLMDQYGHFLERQQNTELFQDMDNSPAYPTRNTSTTQTFDVATIVQASQAISGEIRLESLLGKMMNIIMVNAGANQGCLLLEQDGSLVVQATARSGKVETMQNIPLADYSDLPHSLILFVSRVKEPQVLDHAAQQGNFSQDPYILKHQTRSVLCSPIVLLNKLYGIIYLENTLNTGAFTEDRLKILYLLSAQMAISIQNATLYSNLEKKVEERTAEIQQVNQNLNLAYSEIRARNENMIASITYARRIQNAILPSDERVSHALKNCFVYYQPKDIVSGDFYWFSELGGECFFAVGDCTGHGVPGAFMTLIANTLLNQIINENEITDPGTILHELDKRLLLTLQQQQGEDYQINDGMDIALIRIGSSGITAAGAKRPVLFTLGNELHEIRGSKFPIGSILNQEKKFETFQVPCMPGDMIYLFTDGYVDQFSPEKKKYMIRRFRHLLGSIHMQPPSSQKDALRTNFENWKQDQIQIDDVLVAGIRVS